MTIVLLLIAATALATAVHLAGTVIAARLMRVPIKVVNFGVGFTLAKIDLSRARVSLRLKLVPLAANVTFATEQDGLRGGRAFDDLNRMQKIAAALSGCAACVIVACLVLGPLAALRETAASWGEFFGVLVAFPWIAGQWAPIADAVRSHGFVMLVALACAKVGGLNLLPLAPLNGGMALMLLLGWRLDGTQPAWTADLYLKVSLLILAVVALLWLIGGAIYFAARG